MNVLVALQDGGLPVGMLKQISEYSRCIIIMIGGTMVAYYPVREDIAKHASGLYSLFCPRLLCLAFLACFTLLLLTYCLLLGRFSERLYIAATILVCITSFFSMLTSVSFLVLLNRSYILVTIFLLIVLGTAMFIFYYGVKTAHAHDIDDYEAHQQEKLKQFFDLSAQVTSAAFGGMIATCFGYFKNFPKDVDRVDFKFSEVFIVLTVISGLVVMLLTTVPPSRRRPARSRYIAFIGFLMYTLFGLLALTGLVVAAEFSGEFFFVALFPVFFSVGVWFRKELLQEEDGTSQSHGATGHENEHDTPSMNISTLIFRTFITLYGLYYGSEYNDTRLKICMVFLSGAFMSSLCRMIPLFKRPGTQSLKKAAMIHTYSTIACSSLSVIFLFFW